MSGIKVNGADYVTFTYGEGTLNDKPTEEVTSTNANGDVYKLIQARDGSYVKLLINGENRREQTYNDDGTPATDSDGRTRITRTYSYDDNGFVTGITDKKYSEVVYSESYAYNVYGELSKITTNDGDEHTYTYRGDFTRYLQSESPTKGVTSSYERDYHFRPVKYVTTDNGTVETAQISWMLNTPNTVNLPVGLELKRSGSTQTLTYTYDTLKNITSITDGSNTTTYEYDKVNRLVKEVNPHFGTCEYAYDKNGNITSKKVNGTTYSYTYDGDKLISFNGKSCTYDAMGNPKIYLGKTVKWQGRMLTEINGIGFAYDGRGRRFEKDNITFTYDENGNLVQQSDGIKYFYNTFGIAGIIKGGVKYHYSKDIQGNIIAILDSTGKVVVQYWYDAWGNHKVVDGNGNEITDQNHIGNINPFRYRGYYFDIETGLYYLQTRYYDPTIGRFISCDSIGYSNPGAVNGLNLYVYCLNNPVIYIDSLGRQAVVNVSIDWWYLVNASGVGFHPDRYTPKRSFSPINSIESFNNYLLYAGENLLSSIDLKIVSWNAKLLSFGNNNLTIASIGLDAFDVQFYIYESASIGIKLGTIRLDLFDISLQPDNLKLNIIDVQATIATIGVYSDYIDAELLLGSVGAAVKWNDGALSIGLSIGIGLKITIRFF